MAENKRYVVDCRRHPSASGCTLTMAGTEQEVLDCAVLHSVSVHGHADTLELRDSIRAIMTEEKQPAPV
ncbi:MAG: DUF1059 domain-containing protein [Pseudomonadota bacterium]|nr:DUF1059 domain-containing protein [Pseudomonadota bacterium]